MIYRWRGVHIMDAQLFNKYKQGYCSLIGVFPCHLSCHKLGGNIETNSKNIFRAFNFFLKLSTSIVYINMYSHVKVEIQTHIRKVHTEMTILGLIRKNRTKKLKTWFLSFREHEPHIWYFHIIFSSLNFYLFIYWYKCNLYTCHAHAPIDFLYIYWASLYLYI